MGYYKGFQIRVKIVVFRPDVAKSSVPGLRGPQPVADNGERALPAGIGLQLLAPNYFEPYGCNQSGQKEIVVLDQLSSPRPRKLL